MSSEFDPFKPETGLKSDFDGVVRDAVFQKGDNSQNYSAQLMLLADDGEEVSVFLGVGGDWATYDGGITIEHPKGFEKGFHVNTAYSKWIAKCIDVGAEDVLRERNRQLKNRGAQNSTIWHGLRFHFDTVKVATNVRTVEKDSDGTEKAVWSQGERDAIMPVKFLSVEGEGTTGSRAQAAASPQASASSPQNSTTTPAPTPTTSAPATTPASVGAAASTGDHGLTNIELAKLKLLAKSNEYGAWVDEVLNFESGKLVNNDAVMAELGDDSQAWYLALRA